jgi:CubicO group peptidase (beta-lactamase class C family)
MNQLYKIHRVTATTAVFLLLLLSVDVFSQIAKSLPRSTPEKEGVQSQGILTFLDSAMMGNNEFHSFMILRHGKVISEGWWDPYRSDIKHTMYSCSKSFTATAVGLAANEKLLNVNDKVITFFRDQLPDTVGAYMREVAIKDLLTMSVGQDPDPTFQVVDDTNWVKSFLATPILNKPGSKFLYNSLATYMLSAIVQKVTGEKVIDYLKPRLFEPLGIEDVDWETDPKGVNTGGWGLRLRTEDMAKFGQLFLQRGRWNGKRILPESWIKDASSAKIIQHPEYSQSKRDSSDWEQGYGYQMWRCRNNAFRADGAFGQFIVVMPDQDAVVVITSESPDMQDELNMVWKFLLPAMQNKKVSVNDSTNQALAQQLRSLVLPIPVNNNTSDLVPSIEGKDFTMDSNEYKIQSISFDFDDETCVLTMKTNTDVYRLSFGAGKWKEGETKRKGPYLVNKAQAYLEGLPPFKVAGVYNWRDDNKLVLVLRYIESPHTETMTFRFDENKLQVEMRKSFSDAKTVLTGEMKN